MRKELCFILVIFITSCSLSYTKLLSQEKNMVTEQQAVEIAKEKFLQLGYGSVEHYNIKVTDEFDKTKWSVIFQGIGEYARPGYHAIIDVDKETGKTTYMPGE